MTHRYEAATEFEKFVVDKMGLPIEEHEVKFGHLTVTQYTHYTEVLYMIHVDIMLDKKYDYMSIEKKENIVKNRFYNAFPYMKP